VFFCSPACVSAFALDTSSKPVKFRVVAIAEEGNSPHNEFVAAAKFGWDNWRRKMTLPSTTSRIPIPSTMLSSRSTGYYSTQLSTVSLDSGGQESL